MATVMEMQNAMKNYTNKMDEVNKKADELLKKAAEINALASAMPVVAMNTKKRKKIFGIF